MERKKYETCLNVLKEELIPAMGCTEPVAVAYAAALARDTLGAMPERAEVAVSGNILKNVKSVVVPNTGGLRGVAVAVAAGIVAGDASKELEVLSAITAEEIGRIAPYMQSAPIAVKESDSGCVFDIGVRVFCGADEAFVRIAERHTNVVRVEKNGEVLRSGESGETGAETPQADFSVKDIVEFADTVALSDVEETLERQIAFNGAICEEGLKTDYGARVGKILLSAFGNDVHNRAKATAAAGSDARMNGCELPVVIVSGSGNQGITASVPVIVYAKELGVPHEKLLRALVVSNLVTVHLKRGSVVFPPIAARSARAAARARGYATCAAAAIKRSRIPSSTRSRSSRASSATARNRAARRRSHPLWRRGWSAWRCTAAGASSSAETASWKREWKTPSAPWAILPATECAKRTRRSSV